jgi:hypothetical protein
LAEFAMVCDPVLRFHTINIRGADRRGAGKFLSVGRWGATLALVVDVAHAILAFSRRHLHTS